MTSSADEIAALEEQIAQLQHEEPGAPQADSAAEHEEPREPRTHYVSGGDDTIYALAEREYGDRAAFPRIVDANPGVIRDPDVLPIGATLVLP